MLGYELSHVIIERKIEGKQGRHRDAWLKGVVREII
jgi:hypothetical protein